MYPPAKSARPASRLSEKTHQQLKSYAMAATTAGVGMLALTQPADAKIIYVPTHKHITLGHGVSLALNRKGIVNFKLSVRHVYTESGYPYIIGITNARNPNSVAGYPGIDSDSSVRASALKAGQQIGTQLFFVTEGRFSTGIDMAASGSGPCAGPWANVKKRYLGFKFRVKNEPTQYGWARLNVTCGTQKGTISGVLTGYAYESTPNKPIIAGKTKGPDVITVDERTLGHLARGSARF